MHAPTSDPRLPAGHRIGTRRGIAVLCLGNGEQGYLLTELFRHIDGRTLRPTNRATLFTNSTIICHHTAPLISTSEPHIIYVTVYNREHRMFEPTRFYVLALDMHLRKVVSSFKIPYKDGVVADQRILTLPPT